MVDQVRTASGQQAHPWAINNRINEDDAPPGWNYTIALDLFSRIWDLRRPVLLEKTPSQWLRIKSMVEGVRDAMSQQAIQMPFFARAGVRTLNVHAVLMWRPWCLCAISSHARRYEVTGAKTNDSTQWAQAEFVRLNRGLVERHQALTKRLRVPTLILSYADVIWRPARSASRLETFLPALFPLNASFVPRLGDEIFRGNQFKVKGSIDTYASKLPAPQTIGLDLETGFCAVNALNGRYNPSHLLPTDAERAEAASYADYLSALS